MNKPLILIVLFLLSACQSKHFDTEQAMVDFLKEESNGYYYEKQVNGIDLSLMYRPTDLLVEQSLPSHYDEGIVDSLRHHYGKYLYFNLSMSKSGQELLSTAPRNRNEFGAMVNQLAFGMGNYVHLYTNTKDTIAMVDYVYPRMYGMSKSTSMLFVYPRKEALQGSHITFSLEDLGLITGEVSFRIPSTNIKNEPKLKF